MRRRVFRLINADLCGSGLGELAILPAADDQTTVTVNSLPFMDNGMIVDLMDAGDNNTLHVDGGTVSAIDITESGYTVTLGGAASGTAATDYFTVADSVATAASLHMNGVLSVMCGGDEGHYAAAEPVIAAYARVCRRLGPSGSGQIAKMMNQIAIAGLVQGLAEALRFGEKAGLDGKAVVEVISQGAAGSWQMANRHATMLEDRFDFGFAVDWMRKDLGICLATADEIGAPLPVTALADQFYKDVQAMGGGRWDTSSLIARLRAFDGAR